MPFSTFDDGQIKYRALTKTVAWTAAATAAWAAVEHEDESVLENDGG